MTFDDLENFISLFFTIIGLLLCLFKYITYSKRGYLYLITFFILRFLSDYYWMVYQLIMRDSPDSYRYVANVGWNIGYVVLFFTVIYFQTPERRRFLHPLIVLPLLTNIPQMFLYLPYDSLIVNIWEVGITTLIMIFCLKDFIFYVKNKKNGIGFPHLSVLVFAYTVMEYGMWTSSCFDWPSEILSPYFYFNILESLIIIFFAWGAAKDYESKESVTIKTHDAELRTQAAIQAMLTFLIFGGCIAGYFIIEKFFEYNLFGGLSMIIYITSIFLIMMIMALLYLFSTYYDKLKKILLEMDFAKRSKNSFIVTLTVTFLLMFIVVAYNTKVLFDTSVLDVYEDGDDKIKMMSTDLDNYLTMAQSTLRVSADTIDLMDKNGNSAQDIYKYLLDQTAIQSEQFDENFTGIYAYVNGEYLDGSGWIPPEDFDPESRDWYKAAAEDPGEVVIVSPYLDAQTGYVVVTFAKCISVEEETGKYNVVCLDVIVNHINDVVYRTDIAGKGYAMVVNDDGFIVAHYEKDYNGKYIPEVYDQDIMPMVIETIDGRFNAFVDDENCTLFVHPIMGQWYAVIVVTDEELFENVNSQLVINVIVSMIIFFFISYFYYLGYRSEQENAQKIKDMNMRMVTALASTIDAKDRYTSGHSQRVADYSVLIAEHMGKSKEDLRMIYVAGLLHDVGKIRVPEEIINKPGRLEKDEMDAIRVHPVSGYHILTGLHEDTRIGYGAKYHHERYDGNGYPNCLEAENIPEVARIIAVADAYDAMASDRSYRKALSQDVIRKEIEKGKGSQFDPEIADIMISLIDEDKEYELKQKDAVTDTVLVIDDVQMAITHVRHILEKMDGIRVVSAMNEEDAFEALEKTNISLILLDLKIADIDGFDMYVRIRKKYDMPVVLMTGDKSMETLQKIRELGIDDYVTKPLNPAITKEVVYGILHRSEIVPKSFML